MIPVTATFHVGEMAVMVTDGGAHPAKQWAITTALMIVKPRSDASVEARAEVRNLQLRIAGELVGVFEEVKAATSATEIVVITSQAARRIGDLAGGTQWADLFTAPPIQTAIEELIRRNLASAQDIALKVE